MSGKKHAVENLPDMNREIDGKEIFFADFHVHSRYSMATSKRMEVEFIFAASQLKGLGVVGTGDITHPAWMSDIRRKLVPAEPGLYAIHPDLAVSIETTVPESCRNPVRFMLTAEISCIYRQDNQVRKGHYLVLMPDMASAERFCRRLETIGNLKADGRPILGISAYRLLEMVLETSEKAFLIPAHIWTPWFSVLGSKSGFDSIEACFGKLHDQVFALETGLSSDPAMNRMISALDRFCLVSNSDAHSPEHLGREANVFCGDCSFEGIRKALDGKNPQNFLGTIEWYPQEGKYHLDGHAACHFRCLPEETQQMNQRCPICGKPLTIGVLNRCQRLSDRSEQATLDRMVWYSVPLVELISQITGKGVRTKQVQRIYTDMLAALGPELDILHRLSLETIEQVHPVLAKAIGNMRKGNVAVDPGFDGKYGSVRVWPEIDHRK